MKPAPFVLLLLAASCNRDEDDTPWERTPAGYTVYFHDRGTVKTGLSDRPTLYAEFDAAVDLAADRMLTQYGTPKDDFYRAARLHKFHLHDHIYLVYHGIRVTGYHEDRSEGIIGLAYWPYLSDPVAPDPTSPEWTRYYSAITDAWYWGVHDTARLYPALAHEIGHHLYGPTFEHKAQQIF
jgi:hypothetical protein